MSRNPALNYILNADYTVFPNQWYCLDVACDGTTVTLYVDKLNGNGFPSGRDVALRPANNTAKCPIRLVIPAKAPNPA